MNPIYEKIIVASIDFKGGVISLNNLVQVFDEVMTYTDLLPDKIFDYYAELEEYNADMLDKNRKLSVGERRRVLRILSIIESAIHGVRGE